MFGNQNPSEGEMNSRCPFSCVSQVATLADADIRERIAPMRFAPEEVDLTLEVLLVSMTCKGFEQPREVRKLGRLRYLWAAWELFFL